MDSQGRPADRSPGESPAGGSGAGGGGARAALLRDTIAYVAEHGIGDVSLRQLAAGIGTSHRMIIYHFGSRDGLLVEVVRAMEAQQRAALADLRNDPVSSAVDLGRRMWQRLSDPALAPFERLFFEIYGQALQGRPYALPLLDGVVEDWLGPLAEILIQEGMSPQEARAQARLGLATTRGLLLDLLATGDLDGVTQAMEASIAAFERGQARRHGEGASADAVRES